VNPCRFESLIREFRHDPESVYNTSLMTIRKVFRSGRSFVISIPVEWVRDMHLEGQSVEVIRTDAGEIIIRPIPAPAEAEVTPAVEDLLDEFMQKYDGALKGLAKR
jgi:virulence-associated protein VagC